MGGFGGGLEQIQVEMDPRSVLAAVAQMNAAVADMEKGVTGSGDKVNRTWQTIAETMTRTVDRTKNAADSYIRSLERQAAASGKIGLDKLNAQMQQAIKNYGYSEQAINKITEAYHKLAEAQERTAKPPTGGGESGSEFNSRYLIFGAKDLLEGRVKNAGAEAVNVLQGLKGASAILGSTVAAFGAVTAAVYEGSKALAEWAVQQKDMELKTGLSAKELGELSYAAKAVGTDTSIVERLMRGLTMAVEDTSVKGQKARDVLRGMGVDIEGLRSGIVPTGEVLRQISTAFKENGDVLSRDKEALDLFKRAGIEAVPFLTELNANIKHASEAGFGFDQAMIDTGANTQKALADMEVRWDHIKLKIEDTAASILGLVVNTNKWGDVFDQYDKFQQKQTGLKDGISDISKISGSGIHVTVANSQMQRDRDTTESGLEFQLNAARQRASSASETYFTSSDPLGKWRDAWQKAEADVKRYTEALRKLHEEENRSRREGDEENQFRLQVQQRTDLQGESPLRRVLTDRDAMLREVQEKFKDRPQSDRDALSKFVADHYAHAFTAQLEKDLRTSQEKAAEEITKQAEQQLSIEKSIGEQNAKQLEESTKSGFFQPMAGGAMIPMSQLTQTAGMGTPPGPSSQQQAELTKDMLAQESRRIELMAGPGGELAAARQILELKQESLAIDERQAIQEAQSITSQFDREKKIYDIRLDYAQKVYDAEAQFQDQLLEKQKQVAQTAAGLYHTLFTQPDKFAKQLQSTIKEAALKPVTESLGNLTAQAVTPMIYGQNGKGGISGIFSGGFAAKSSPLGDVQSTNGAMHVFVTNPGSPGSSAPYFGSSGAPGFAGTTSVAGAPMGPVPSFGGSYSGGSFSGGSFSGGSFSGGPSVISIPMGGGGAVSVPYFGGGTPSFSGGGFSSGGGFAGGGLSSVSLPYFGGSGPSESSTVSLPYFGASAPLFSGGTSSEGTSGGFGGIGSGFGSGSGFSGTGYQGFDGYGRPTGGGATSGVAGNIASTALRAFAGVTAPGTGGLGGNPAGAIGPGGTAGFAGPLKQVNSIGGRFAGMGANLGPAFGIGQGGISSDNPFSDSDNPLGPQMAAGGDTTFGSVMSSQGAGAVMGAVGLPLAENGLLGNNRGTGMGVLEGGIGGALEGASIGTMILPGLGTAIGAGVGAAAGALIGVGEMLAGVVSPQNRVIQLVKQMYHVSIPASEADKIVSLAKQSFGNNLGVAVRSPQVRQMLGLYAAGTGQSQNSLLSSMVPHAGSLVMQGGALYQQASYQYGQPYAYQSNLPVLGGPVAGTYPNPSGGGSSPTSVSLNINGSSAADLLEGRIASTVDSTYVADQMQAASASSYGRVQSSADLSQPGLITG